ncbi:MAG: response regulator transcription factor [Bacteroidales bacterium]|nr:response regulator transcription factor [Bacteroidales bacterium]
MNPFSVCIVDDHKLFREGLSILLESLPYIKNVQEASDGYMFLELLNTFKPDLIFMDIGMPGMDGIETTIQALEKYPDLKIIALSMYADEDYYTRMINAGARGFILKNSGMKQVEECLENVISGFNYFSPEILSGITRNLTKKKRPLKSGLLSEREEEVLYHICQGLSNHEIAENIGISKRTVDKHRENILLKTESKNTAGLVMYAIRNGIVDV